MESQNPEQLISESEMQTINIHWDPEYELQLPCIE